MFYFRTMLTMRSLLCGLLLFPLTLTAQNKKPAEESDFYFVLDRNWQPCHIDTATYLVYMQKADDTTYRWHQYHFSGPLLTIETYRDEERTIPNGYFAYFDAKGNIDSAGNCLAGYKQGSWYHYTDSLTIVTEEVFNKGLLTERINTAGKKRDTTWHEGDREARFTRNDDSEKDWRKYIQTNLQMPERAVNLEKSGTVYLSFRIDTTGRVKDVHLLRSVEYSLDREAMRVFTNSPAWIPAEERGQRIDAFRKQPLTFVNGSE